MNREGYRRNYTSHAILGLAGLLIGLAVALGYTSPSERIKAVEIAAKELKDHVVAHDVEFGRVNVKLDYISDGLDDLLGREHRNHENRHSNP